MARDAEEHLVSARDKDPLMHEWLQRARTLGPLIEQYRDQGEETRRLPRPLFDAMREAGLFRMWAPRRFGGEELEPEVELQVVEELSRHDGSVGWNVMIAANHDLLWGYLDTEVAGAIMGGNADAVIAGTIFAGTGTAQPAPGGYRISGRWRFASGCHHADCMVASCTISDEGGRPRVGPDGVPQIFGFLLKPADCKIIDTWHTTGMRGTGSQDFETHDAFVPEGYYWQAGARACDPGPLYNMPIYYFWAPNLAAVALGIARSAIDAFVELAANKRSTRNPTVLAQREVVQTQMGEAEALVRSGRSFVFEALRSNWASLTAGRAVSEEQLACLRLAAATAVSNAVRAVDLMYAAAGSASIYERSRIERCFRDVHMMPQHAVVGPAVFGLVGRFFLGLGLGR